MEFTCSAPRGVEDSRPPGFPGHRPPPHDGDLAAARRREELMWELHKERIRQDMILRELAETERAMAVRFEPPCHWPLQAHCHQRRPPSLPPWVEAAPRTPRAITGHPLSPAAATPPPMYPHVERSPSPVPLPPLGDDGDHQQQECPSSDATVLPVLSVDSEGFRTLPEEALVPASANAGARTTMYASFAQEVTPGDRQEVGGEPEHGVEDGHGVQPFCGSGNHSNEHRKNVESTIKDQTNELVAQPCQYGPASQENATSHEQKRIAFREPTPQAEGLKRKLMTTLTPPITAKKQKPPRWTCDLCQVVTPLNKRKVVEHKAGKRHQSKLKARNRPARATPGSPPLRRNNVESVAENGGGGNAPRPADGEDREPPQSARWWCQVCDARFNSASSLQEHRGGKLHRGNTEAILAKFRSSYSRKNCDGSGKNVRYYCKTCDVHCTGNTTLASHLVGRRHRRKRCE